MDLDKKKKELEETKAAIENKVARTGAKMEQLRETLNDLNRAYLLVLGKLELLMEMKKDAVKKE